VTAPVLIRPAPSARSGTVFVGVARRRRHRAKGSVLAFAPTASSTYRAKLPLSSLQQLLIFFHHVAKPTCFTVVRFVSPGALFWYPWL
jgi:hypothetical protein